MINASVISLWTDGVYFIFWQQGMPSELTTDESTMWGARYNSQKSLAACPNSTTDFAMLAQCVSTPFTHKVLLSSNFFPHQGSVTYIKTCIHEET